MQKANFLHLFRDCPLSFAQLKAQKTQEENSTTEKEIVLIDLEGNSNLPPKPVIGGEEPHELGPGEEPSTCIKSVGGDVEVAGENHLHLFLCPRGPTKTFTAHLWIRTATPPGHPTCVLFLI